MLEGWVSSAGAMATSAATWGTTWWRGTACAYPFVQEWIGWCPQPSICDYVPNSLNSLCQFVVENSDYYLTPLAESYGTQAVAITTIAVATALTTWIAYRENQTERQLEYPSQVSIDIVKEINERLLALQAQVASLEKKFDKLTPEEKTQEIDLVKRARKALEGYLKQAGVGDVFYGDRIRDMGLELLEKRAKGEPLFSSSSKVVQAEEDRLQRVLDAKEAEQTTRRYEKSTAYAHHAKDISSQDRPSQERPNQHQQLMSEIESKKAKKSRPN